MIARNFNSAADSALRVAVRSTGEYPGCVSTDLKNIVDSVKNRTDYAESLVTGLLLRLNSTPFEIRRAAHSNSWHD
ncbi:MAG: hypothetical protein WCF18_07465 [Chthoniobacteraceae bacterium]